MKYLYFKTIIVYLEWIIHIIYSVIVVLLSIVEEKKRH